jgi:hypothetical protein
MAILTPHFLEVIIPDHNSFYSLFADGLHSWKTYDRAKRATIITYPRNAVLFLYYTYPTHREACAVRNTPPESGGLLLPGLSKTVSPLFSVRASKVDKLKRAVAFLNKHSGGAYDRDDGFYIRLFFLLQQRGKINYIALEKLAENTSARSRPAWAL